MNRSNTHTHTQTRTHTHTHTHIHHWELIKWSNPLAQTHKFLPFMFDFLMLNIWHNKNYGSGELSGKMLLVSIIETNKINDYLGQVGLSKG